MPHGMRELFADVRHAADTLDAALRERLLLHPPAPADLARQGRRRRLRPTFVLKLAFKLHPELRRRTKQAEATLGRQAVAGRPSGSGRTHERADVRGREPRPPGRRPRRTRRPTAWPPLRGRARARRCAATTATSCSTATTSARSGSCWSHARRWGIAPTTSCPRSRARRPRTSEPARILGRLRGRGGRERHDADLARRRPGPLARGRGRARPATCATAACWCSAATTSTASRWASCPTSCSPTILDGRDAAGTLRSRRGGRRAARPRARAPTGPSSTTCSPRPASP